MASKARNPRTKKVAYVVEQHNLDQFLAKYISVKELAALLDLNSRTIITSTGKHIPTRIDTVCLHGDTAEACDIAKAIQTKLQAEGISIQKM